MQDSYVIESSDPKLLALRRNERNKVYWKKLKRHFGKKPLKTITSVEYTKFGGVVKATNKGEIERAIMKENSKRF